MYTELSIRIIVINRYEKIKIIIINVMITSVVRKEGYTYTTEKVTA